MLIFNFLGCKGCKESLSNKRTKQNTMNKTNTTNTTATANSSAREFVKSLKPFKGSNTFGEWNGDCYAVFSYGYHFPLFAFIAGKWYRNGDKYSRSTSKQQSQLAPVANVEMETVSTEGLKKLIIIQILNLR